MSDSLENEDTKNIEDYNEYEMYCVDENTNKESLFDSLNKMSEIMEEASVQREKDCDWYWNNLTEEEREMSFYSVLKRLYKSEVEDNGTYRWALYDVFGFGPNMYTDGMDCGFMTLHNMLFDAKELEAMSKVTRLEVIDETGRAYVKYFDKGSVEYSLQDDDRTLKIFIDERKEDERQAQFDF